MTGFVDSHCHIDLIAPEDIGGDVDFILQNAAENNVSHMLCVSVDKENQPDVLALAEKYPNIYASAGIHPNSGEQHEVTLDELCEMADHEKIIAIGETGLDYFRSEGDLDWQRERFKIHISAAKKLKKPLIIHTREAAQDTLRILNEEDAEQAGGVMHCFAEDWDVAIASLDIGFYISFSGIVTFKSAKTLQEVARKVPLDRMLIETDSPWLAPVPFRGKTNQPAYVKHVAEFIAELRNEDVNTIMDQTRENFFNLFSIN